MDAFVSSVCPAVETCWFISVILKKQNVYLKHAGIRKQDAVLLGCRSDGVYGGDVRMVPLQAVVFVVGNL